MNVTLAMPENLVAESRRYAAAHGTTLNALLRDLLSGLNEQGDREKERQEKIYEMMDIMRMSTASSPEGWKFNREEAHRGGRDAG